MYMIKAQIILGFNYDRCYFVIHKFFMEKNCENMYDHKYMRIKVGRYDDETMDDSNNEAG